MGGKNNIKEIVSAIITCIFFTTAPPTRPPVPGSGLARRRRLPRCNPSRLIRLPSLREISQSICRCAIHRSHSPPDPRRHPAPTPPHLRCEDEGRRCGMMGWSRDAGEGRRAGPRSCGRCGGADARAGAGSRAPAKGWRAPSPPCKRPRTPSGSAYPSTASTPAASPPGSRPRSGGSRRRDTSTAKTAAGSTAASDTASSAARRHGRTPG